MKKYDETMAILNQMATVKMMMNAHKGQIEDVDQGDLIRMMANEMDELNEAINQRDMIGVIEEAADVMNFLVGLVHQQLTMYRSRENAKT